jgi:hypothetical protein
MDKEKCGITMGNYSVMKRKKNFLRTWMNLVDIISQAQKILHNLTYTVYGIKLCNSSWVLVAHTCNPNSIFLWLFWRWGLGSYFPRKAEMGKTAVQSQLGGKVLKIPSPKIGRQKWAVLCDRSVACLLCKCKALSSNPSPTKRKKV